MNQWWLPVGLSVACAALTLWLTGVVRAWALAREVIDTPNSRGLHTVPTPRGGGAAIACTVLLAQLGLVANGLLPLRWTLAAVFASGSLALLGWIDDLYRLRASTRAVVQVVVCTLWLAVSFESELTRVALLGGIGLCVAMVGFINLYNFMDGSDGLAATQAIVAGLLGGSYAWWNAQPALAFTAFALAGACAGFLAWNWHPAKIFMGDVGSYFLGTTFAIIGTSALLQGHPAWVWLLLLAPFITDGTLTLARRALRREPLFQPHRTHAYQLLVRNGWTHRDVVWLLLAVLGALCFPLVAAYCWLDRAGAILVASGYTLLAIGWWLIVSKRRGDW